MDELITLTLELLKLDKLNIEGEYIYVYMLIPFFRRKNNMVKCEECNKKLSILQGYRHPALGKRFLVCGNCFVNIEGCMEKWKTFCLSNSFNAELSKIHIHDEWNKSISNNLQLQKWFSDLWIKIES